MDSPKPAKAAEKRNNENTSNLKFLDYSLTKITLDAGLRISKATTNLSTAICGAVLLVPRTVSAQAVDGYGYPNLNSDKPTYNDFIAGPANGSDSDGQKVLADVDNFLASSLNWVAFKHRADQIRQSGVQKYCIGNLSIALTGLGGAYQAGASGATTLLTLLPTAGALIGTPVTELWMLYKLMPLAGLISMVLSLGGNIVPAEVNDYERVATDFTYSGMIASNPDQRNAHAVNIDDDDVPDLGTADAKDQKEAIRFAKKVAARAMKDKSGSRKTVVIAGGISIQIFLLGLIMVACWFMQAGSIVVWWCTFYPWMYFWYGFVALSSLLENLAGVPFTHQWTIRVSRAPKVGISPDAPWAIPEPQPDILETRYQMEIQPSASKGPAAFDDEIAYQGHQLTPSTHSDISGEPPKFRPSRYSAVPQQPFGQGQILNRLKKGYNTFGRVVIDPNKPWSAAKDAFYVIISERGVDYSHAFLRVFSKILTIGVYTVGTAMFASSTLATILVAVVVASLVIVAGVFGRVTAMWMASELMKDRPILHKVAKDRKDAELYIEAMLREPGMVFEVLGHVITDGRVIKRYRKPLRWSSILGVLADPYDITKLATPAYSKV